MILKDANVKDEFFEAQTHAYDYARLGLLELEIEPIRHLEIPEAEGLLQHFTMVIRSPGLE